MAVRNIVKIDEEKCNGCGLCISSCAEGAIQMVNGKAKLVSDTYCDGLGACLGECPQGAITIEQREAAEFDEEKAMEHVSKLQESENKPPEKLACGCPGTMAKSIEREKSPAPAAQAAEDAESQLENWPVQLKLVSPNAPYFKNADLLLAADCVPFALATFHSEMLAGKKLVVGCPKLDDGQYYVDKLTELIRMSEIKSLTVAHMEVPCCTGLVKIAEMAIENSGRSVAFEDIVVSIDGKVIQKSWKRG